MRIRLLIFGLLILVLGSCKDKVPQVILVEYPPVSKNVIDNYYYVQFSWGKVSLKDTVTMEIPDDTLGTDSTQFSWDLERDYMQSVYDMRNHPIWDTTNAEEEDLPREEILKLGWNYAPTCAFYTRRAYDYFNGPDINAFVSKDNYLDNFYTYIINRSYRPEDFDLETDTDPASIAENKAYQNIFFASFPWKDEKDTLPFWDIEDYLYNPSIETGIVRWGRIGTTDLVDSIWNNDVFDGVVLHYRDSEGVVWETDNPPTFQDGSYFKINSKILNRRNGLSYYIIEGEFAARFYNDRGEYKQARDGKFRMNILSDIELGAQPE
jgi:hypothetical protein